MPPIKTRVIKDMVMPGGWHFFQKFNNDKIKITAGTYEELLREVFNFRSWNGIQTDNVQQEVDEYICSTYPRQCQPVPGKVISNPGQSIPSTQKARFVDELVRWALDKTNETCEFVLPSVAETRTMLCRECPYNREWRTSGCAGCNSNAERVFMIARRGKDVVYGKKLMGCSLHKHDNRTAVWMRSPSPRHAKAPDKCWVDKIHNPGDHL